MSFGSFVRDSVGLGSKHGGSGVGGFIGDALDVSGDSAMFHGIKASGIGRGNTWDHVPLMNWLPGVNLGRDYAQEHPWLADAVPLVAGAVGSFFGGPAVGAAVGAGAGLLAGMETDANRKQYTQHVSSGLAGSAIGSGAASATSSGYASGGTAAGTSAESGGGYYDAGYVGAGDSASAGGYGTAAGGGSAGTLNGAGYGGAGQNMVVEMPATEPGASPGYMTAGDLGGTPPADYMGAVNYTGAPGYASPTSTYYQQYGASYPGLGVRQVADTAALSASQPQTGAAPTQGQKGSSVLNRRNLGTAMTLKTGLGMYQNYQQQKALQGELDARNSAMRRISRAEANPMLVYANDPGMIARRQASLGDVIAADRAFGGGGGRLAEDLVRTGSEFDRSALNDYIGRQYEMMGATQPSYQAKLGLGGSPTGGAAGVAQQGLSDYAFMQWLQSMHQGGGY